MRVTVARESLPKPPANLAREITTAPSGSHVSMEHARAARIPALPTMGTPICKAPVMTVRVASAEGDRAATYRWPASTISATRTAIAPDRTGMDICLRVVSQRPTYDAVEVVELSARDPRIQGLAPLQSCVFQVSKVVVLTML